MRAPGRPLAGNDGFLTIQYVLAVALSLLLIAQIANLLVAAYGRGAVRAALDEGVRAASLGGAVHGQCEARAEAVLADLLGGTMRAGVGPIRCVLSADRVAASVETRFPAWLPGMPDHAFTTSARVVREGAP